MHILSLSLSLSLSHTHVKQRTSFSWGFSYSYPDGAWRGRDVVASNWKHPAHLHSSERVHFFFLCATSPRVCLCVYIWERKMCFWRVTQPRESFWLFNTAKLEAEDVLTSSIFFFLRVLFLSLKSGGCCKSAHTYSAVMNESTERDLQIYASCFLKENMFMSHQDLCGIWQMQTAVHFAVLGIVMHHVTGETQRSWYVNVCRCVA